MKTLLIVLIIITVLFVAALIWIAVLMQKNERLCENLAEMDREIQALERRDMIKNAMLPGKLLALFQKDNREPQRLGEEKQVNATVLSFNLPEFSRMIRSRNAKQIFSFVNGVLNQVVPAVLFQEGEIDKFTKAGLNAFYLNQPENALCSAVSICEAISQSKYAGEEYSIGLTYGEVMAGMVGHQKRFGVLTISETTGFAEFLQELGGRFDARILLSGSMKKQIPDFEKRYSSRYLGKIFLRASNTTEELYEVYDGDNPEDKNGKRRTRMLFEKGVELFLERRFYDARLHFIEVLKANRMDGAAREYLYLCNQYQENADDRPETVCIEIY